MNLIPTQNQLKPFQFFWEPIEVKKNNLPVFLVYKIKHSKLKKMLLTHNFQNQTLEKVELEKKNSIYIVTKQISLVITRFQLIQYEYCKQMHKSFQEQMTLGIVLIKGDVKLEIFTQCLETYNNLTNILKGSCAKTNINKTYTFEQVIGSGSYGVITKAINIETNEKVAIKAFNKPHISAQASNQVYMALVNQLEIQKKLQHPNLLKIDDVYESENSIYLVTEILEGKSLIDRILLSDKKGVALKLTHFNIQLIMSQLISAVVYLHEQGIMNRNLRPENIIFKDLSDKFQLVITDFGFAQYVNKPNVIFQRCGSPGYVAPEILNYQEGMEFYNEKCDIYSLGMIFYVLLTGSKPFQGQTKEEIAQNNLKGVINFDHAALKNRSNETISLLKSMAEINPKLRISAQEAENHPYFSQKFKETLYQKQNSNGSINFAQSNIKESITNLKQTSINLTQKSYLKLDSYNELLIKDPLNMVFNSHRPDALPELMKSNYKFQCSFGNGFRKIGSQPSLTQKITSPLNFQDFSQKTSFVQRLLNKEIVSSDDSFQEDLNEMEEGEDKINPIVLQMRDQLKPNFIDKKIHLKSRQNR